MLRRQKFKLETLKLEKYLNMFLFPLFPSLWM